MNDSFLKACRGEEVDRIPVWFMRQAGRSLPGYRKIREKYDVLTLTQTPELAAAVSREPVDTHGVDAAIMFADIMLLPIALGVDLRIVDSVGPVIDEPLDTPSRMRTLKPFTEESVQFLKDTITILKRELTVPVIGFSGAPFTLASYLIEGQPTRTWQKTKHMMFTEPAAWEELMVVLRGATVSYLKAQIAAGADAVQLFDSWVGCLSPYQYRTYVEPHVAYIFNELKETGVPTIYFGTNTTGMLNRFSGLSCDVVGVDWRVELSEAKQYLKNKALQGNLDPMLLLSDWDTVRASVDHMLEGIDPKVGYVANLGHGILPETDEGMVRKLVDYLHGK